MNRRDALLTLLLAPAGVSSMLVQEKQDQNGSPLSVLSPGVTLLMNLADKEETAKNGGIYALRVRYKGKELIFTAAEIWGALSGSGSHAAVGGGELHEDISS